MGMILFIIATLPYCESPGAKAPNSCTCTNDQVLEARPLTQERCLASLPLQDISILILDGDGEGVKVGEESEDVRGE